jgi:hypothetical protein
MRLDYYPRYRALALILLALLALIGGIALAGVPRIINYQGMLTDATGQPVADGEYPIRFRIHDDSTAYSPVWTSQPETVLVVNGLFNYQLGSNEPIPAWTFNDSALWLGITVGSGPEVQEITPRTRFVSAPYAMKAYQAEYAGYADSAGYVLSGSSGWVDDGNVVRLATDTDSVGIGTGSPSKKLEIAGDLHLQGELTWESKTGYLSIPPAAFTDRYSDPTPYLRHNQVGSSNGVYLVAPVQIPQGATITKVTGYFDIQGDLMDSFVWLHRSALDGTWSYMAYFDVYIEGVASYYDDTIDYPVVDNSAFTYYLDVELGPDHYLFGVIIEYEYTGL